MQEFLQSLGSGLWDAALPAVSTVLVAVLTALAVKAFQWLGVTLDDTEKESVAAKIRKAIRATNEAGRRHEAETGQKMEGEVKAQLTTEALINEGMDLKVINKGVDEELPVVRAEEAVVALAAAAKAELAKAVAEKAAAEVAKLSLPKLSPTPGYAGTGR